MSPAAKLFNGKLKAIALPRVCLAKRLVSRASLRIVVAFERRAVPDVDRSAVAFGLPLNAVKRVRPSATSAESAARWRATAALALVRQRPGRSQS